MFFILPNRNLSYRFKICFTRHWNFTQVSPI